MNLLVKKLWISILKDSNKLNQSHSEISLWLVRFKAVVWWLKAFIGPLQGLTLINNRIGTF